MWPVTALVVPVSMVGVLGVRCPTVAFLVPSRVSPQVVGPHAVEAHCVEPVSVGGSSLSGGCLSLPVPFVGAMGFGPSFVAWVDLFYHRVQSSVNVNGYVSAFFDLSRGVRQGCPLSLVPCPPCCRSSYLRFLQPTSAAMPWSWIWSSHSWLSPFLSDFTICG